MLLLPGLRNISHMTASRLPAQELISEYEETSEKAHLTYIADPFPAVSSPASHTQWRLPAGTTAMQQ